MAKIFILQQIKQILFLLDNAVYSLISNVYELIIYLSNVNLVTNNEVLTGLISRVYLLLGIFMLFKVSFSMLQYIIDPNAFSDSSKGFGKLITNTIVSLVLLVSVPFIFEKAYDLQNTIISSNVIPNLILGQKLPDYASSSSSEIQNDFNKRQEQIRSMAKDIQFSIFGAFATINTDENTGIKACATSSDKPSANVIGTADMIDACLDDFVNEATPELNAHGGKLSDFFKYEDNGEIKDERNFSSYANLLWWVKNDEFVINYVPFIPTVIGGYLLLLLVTFAIDIAVRAFKLMFLQMVAPISIVSYIDPKESATQGKLYNWAMECVRTFLSLFLRLAIIFLIVQLVSMLTSLIFKPLSADGTGIYNVGIQPSSEMHIFVYIFLILGLFTFAKQVPGMIESLFNIKGAGDMSLNPFKSLGENALATGIVGGVVGAGAASIASGATALAQGKGLGAIKSAAAGAVSGTVRGGIGGFKGKGIGAAGKAGLHAGGISARNKQMKGELGIDYLHHPIKSAQKSAIKGVSRVSDKIGGPTPGQVLKGRAGQFRKVADAGQDYKNKIETNSAESKAISRNGETYKARFASLNEQKSQIQRQFWEGKITEAERAAQTKATNGAIENLQNEYRERALADELQQEVKHITVDANGNTVETKEIVDVHDYELQNAHDTFDQALNDTYSKSELEKLHLDSIDKISDITESVRVSNDEAERMSNTDFYRTSAQVDDAITNLNKETFYETSGRPGPPS